MSSRSLKHLIVIKLARLQVNNARVEKNRIQLYHNYKLLNIYYTVTVYNASIVTVEILWKPKGLMTRTTRTYMCSFVHKKCSILRI